MIDAAMRPWRRPARRRLAAPVKALALSAVLLGALAPGAWAAAAEGYEPASPSTIPVQGELPQEVAVDQSSRDIYVAIPLAHFSTNTSELKLGQVDQLDASGTPTASSPFAAEQHRIFTGVAVNPVTHGVYAVETSIETPIGTMGTPGRMSQFSSTGTPGTEFSTGGQVNEGPRIAADSSGNVFVPNAATGAVLVYSSSGSLQETIDCGDCPSGSFQQPIGAALDSVNDLYVVDVGRDEVVKLTKSGGSYEYSSVLQSGKDAGAVGVDPSTDSVFVGDYPGGTDYHIVAYNSSGARFDDFGAELFGPVGEGGVAAAGQIAVDATTHSLYASDPSANVLHAFDLVTINRPSTTTEPATPVGQVEATMKATVNPNFHATYDCHFEYMDDASFQPDFSGSSQMPCSSLPNGSNPTSVSASPSSLAPETTYHYRIVAANDAGAETGAAEEFTTLPETLSTVTTQPPSAVLVSGATLNGKLNTHGGTVTDCKFEYGTTQSYGEGLDCAGSIGITSSDVNTSTSVSGLAPDTIFHYRLSVTTNAGMAHGEDVEFTTLTPPPPEEEEPVLEEEGQSVPPAPTVSTSPPPVALPAVKRLVCRKGFRKRRVRGRRRCVKKKHRKRRVHRKHRRHHHRRH